MENLYDVHCRSSVSLQSNLIKDQIHLLSSQSSNQDIFFGFGDQLTLVNDDEALSSFSINLGYAIDVISWSSDGKFIAVGDNSGSISMFLLPNLQQVFKKNVFKLDVIVKQHTCFTSISLCTYKSSHTLVTSSNNGKVCVIRNINFQSKNQGIDDAVDILCDDEIWIDSLSCHENGLSCLLSYYCCYNHLFFSSGFGKYAIAIWKQPVHQDIYNYFTTVKTQSVQLLTGIDNFDGFVKMQQISSFVFCICKNGFLYQFGLPHLFLLKHFTKIAFIDFLVKMPENIVDSRRSNFNKVYGIKKKANSYLVGVYNLQNLDEIFSTSCTGVPSLVTTLNNNVNCIFLDNVKHVDDEKAKKVEIFTLSETSPDSRLCVLLQQHQFEDALKFATKFQLDIQPVYQQQASYLLHSLASADTNAISNLFEEFRQCVTRIDDALFIGEICVTCSIDDVSIIYELLKLARSHLDSGGRAYRATVSCDDHNYINLSLQVDKLLDLLVTFQTAFGSRDGRMWRHFKTSRLSEQVASLLHAGKLQAATVISCRHENDLISDLEAGGEKQLRSLLAIITQDADVDDLVNWLELFIPAVLTSSIPNCVEILTEWLYKRTLSLEELSSHWPDDGIKLANVFFKVQKKLSSIGFVRNQLSATYLLFNNNEELSRLKLLASRLQMLKTLRTRYHCNILLDEFVQETTVSLTFRMLDKVTAPELIPKCLENTVRPYMREHKLNEDSTLLLYIQDVLGTTSKQIFGQFRSLKERKVIAIVNSLTDDKVVVESSLLLAKKASIPWSKAMQELVQRALNVTESRITTQEPLDDDTKALFSSWKSQLSNCVNLEKIPAIASKYDINVISNHKAVNHEFLMRRIVKNDKPEALDDAETIASTFSPTPKVTAYSYRVMYLTGQQRVSDCIELLDLHPEISGELVQRAISRTITILQQTNEMWREERSNHCLACISMIGYLLQRPHLLSPSAVLEWKQDLLMLTNIHHLQTRFDELTSVEQYMDKASRDSRLGSNVVKYYTNVNSNEAQSNVLIQSHDADSSNSSNSSFFSQQSKPAAPALDGSGDRKSESKEIKSFSMLLNLALLLRVPEEAMLSQIAFQAAKKCQGQAAINICKDLFLTQPSQKSVEILEKIAITLLQLLEDHAELICRLIPDICELVSLAVIHCKEKRLVDVTTLHSFCRLSRDVLFGTDLSAGDFLSKCAADGATSRGDKYESAEWLNNWYTETDVLALDSSSVLPRVSRILKKIFNEHGSSLVSIPPSVVPSNSLKHLVDLLTEMTSSLKSSHGLTSSLQWVFRMESIVLSHMSNSPSLFRSNADSEISCMATLVKYSYDEKKVLVQALLEKIFFARQPDLSLAVSSLLFLPDDLAFKILNEVWESNARNFAKISALSRVALRICDFRGNHAQRSKYECLLMDAEWCQRLHSVKISCDRFLLASSHWKQKFLYSLLEHPSLSGSLVFDFCKDYDLDSDKALLHFVNVLLSEGSASRDHVNGVDSPDSCLVQYSQISTLIPMSFPVKVESKSASSRSTVNRTGKSWESIKEEMRWISRNIMDRTLFLKELEKCFRNVISPYDYDKAEFLIELMRSLTSEFASEVAKKNEFLEKAKGLIGFLRYVDRDRPPTDVELHRRWCTDGRSDYRSQDLPFSAHKHLPLHPLLYGDAAMTWKVLSSEASERSVELLVPIARLLGLNADKLYMTAAENAITRSMDAIKKADLNNQQLKKLRGLTEKITSKMMIVAMAKRISEILPRGQEKVDAYQWCLLLISKWRDTLSEGSPDHERVSNAHQTLTRHHRQASCELALTRYGCDSPETELLLNQPSNLVLHLYNHPSIVQRHYEPGDTYPDIHSLTDELGSIYDIDVTKLRLTLTINLLLAAGKSEQRDAEDDSTVTIDRIRSTAMLEESRNRPEEEEIIRLLYLLTYGDPIQQGKYLLKVIGNHQDKRITNSCRVRALLCLFRIVDDDQVLYSLTNKTTDELRADLRVLIYMTELEEANFKVPSSVLRQHDKTSVARSVIASSARQRNPVALRVAAEMCREFGSVPTDVWIVLLQQLVSLQEISYLQRLLPDICRVESVLALPCLASVWQSCVTLPLVALTPPLDAKQKSVALSSYHFLIRCPVLLRIDLEVVAQHFKSLELDVLALACYLISPSGKEQALKMSRSMSYEIKQQLSDLNNHRQPLLGYQLVVEFLEDKIF